MLLRGLLGSGLALSSQTVGFRGQACALCVRLAHLPGLSRASSLALGSGIAQAPSFLLSKALGLGVAGLRPAAARTRAGEACPTLASDAAVPPCHDDHELQRVGVPCRCLHCGAPILLGYGRRAALSCRPGRDWRCCTDACRVAAAVAVERRPTGGCERREEWRMGSGASGED